jgi:hypothetical protein
MPHQDESLMSCQKKIWLMKFEIQCKFYLNPIYLFYFIILHLIFVKILSKIFNYVDSESHGYKF